MYLIGVDIGGTKMEAAVLAVESSPSQESFGVTIAGEHAYGRILGSIRTPTERQNGYDSVMQRLATLVTDAANRYAGGIKAVKGTGLALPGIVNPRTRVMTNGNTPIFIGRNLAADLKSALNGAVHVDADNDANCFALAEALAGAGIAHAQREGVNAAELSSVGLILGTGFGAGIVIRGRILRGLNGSAGEIGHMRLAPQGGHPCYCGGSGCLENYASGTALEAAYASRIYSQIPERPNARRIFELAQEKEPLALAVLHQYRRDLAFILANVTNLLDPDYFVCGGGVSLQSSVYEGLEDLIRRNTYTPGHSPSVYKHVLGDSAGMIGAALLSAH